MNRDVSRLLDQYSQPVQSWPGEEAQDEEARANYAAMHPAPYAGTPARPGEASRDVFLPRMNTADGRREWAVPGFLYDVWEAAKTIRDTSGFGTGPATPFSSLPPAEQDQVLGHAMAGASPLAATGFGRVVAAPVGASEVGIFGGRLAKTANHSALARAEEMAAQGVPREQIWKDTGWFQGVDGKWRFEIDDSTASLRGPKESRAMLDDILGERREKLDWVKSNRESEKAQPDLFPRDAQKARGRAQAEALALKKKAEENYGLTWHPSMGRKAEYVFDHPAIWDAYPDLARGVIVRQDNYGPTPSTRGRYDPDSKSLDIYRAADDARSTGLHEVQHAVQGAEGTATGGNPYQFTDIKAPIEAINRPAIDSLLAKYGVSVPYAENARDFLNKAFDALKGKYDSIAELQPIISEMDRVDKLGVSAYEQYRRLAGEAEARAVQARKDLTPEERRSRPPWLDYDVPEGDQIVRFGGDGVQASVAEPNATPIRGYHGQRQPMVGKYDPKRSQYRAFFLSENPDHAASFARRSEGAALYPVDLSSGARIFDATKPDVARKLVNARKKGSLSFERSYLMGTEALDDLLSKGDAGLLEDPGVQRWLRRNRYDGWKFVDDAAASSLGDRTSYGILRPGHVKSSTSGEVLFSEKPYIPGVILDDEREPYADGGAVADPTKDIEGWAKAIADDLHAWGGRQSGPFSGALSFGADTAAQFPETIVSGAKLMRAPGQWWRGEPMDAGWEDAARVGFSALPLARPLAPLLRAGRFMDEIPIDRTGAAQRRIKQLLDTYNKD